MVFVGRAAGEGFAVRPVHFFRIVMRAFRRTAGDHLVRAGNVLDGAVAA